MKRQNKHSRSEYGGIEEDLSNKAIFGFLFIMLGVMGGILFATFSLCPY